MEMVYDFPLVTAETIYPVLGELGVKPWEECRPAMPREEYISGKLTAEELAELRFMPSVEVTFLRDPKGHAGRYFRHHGRFWATTFALLPNDHVIIVAEWKQGSTEVSIVPPSGVPTKEDMKTHDPYGSCAKREFEQETGLRLREVIKLGTKAIPVSGRQSTQRYFPYLGIVEEPVVRREAKLDSTEFLKGLIMPLTEWWKLLAEMGAVYEDCSYSVTILALTKLGRLKLVPGGAAC